MKRIVGLFLAIALLTGGAFTAQLLSGQAPGSNAQASSPNPIAALISTVQMNGLPLPEPVSIVLSSLVLLGSTTLLRHYRMNRRA